MSSDLFDAILKILGAIGGIGIIVIGLAKLSGNILRDWLKIRAGVGAKKEVELFRQELGLSRIRADQFATAQFAAYIELWRSLQTLKAAGDALWDKASETHLKAFARQLHQTKTHINEGEIFFDSPDYAELQQLLEAFGQFEIGKTQLRRIRSSTKLNASKNMIADQIAANQQYKVHYEVILRKVKDSFRNRLSRLEGEEVA